MKLEQLFETNRSGEQIFAWFEPSRGPEDISGVRLAFIEPLEGHFDTVIANAEKANKPERIERLQKERELYNKRGQKFFTPQIDWWMSEAAFHKGDRGFSNVTRGNLVSTHPNLIIVGSREEAIKRAEEAGLI